MAGRVGRGAGVGTMGWVEGPAVAGERVGMGLMMVEVEGGSSSPMEAASVHSLPFKAFVPAVLGVGTYSTSMLSEGGHGGSLFQG